MRESIGDFDTNESFINNSDFKILIWIVYLIIMIVGNIIIMNFIIAVVNGSYEECMQKGYQKHFKGRLQMVKERESLMTEDDFKNKKWFPNFIILCKPENKSSNADSEIKKNEMNGVLKEIELQKQNISTITDDINNLKEEIYKKMDEADKKMDKRMEEMDQKIYKIMDEADKKMESRMDELRNLIINNQNKQLIV